MSTFSYINVYVRCTYVLRKIWHDAHQAKHYRPCIVPHVDPIVLCTQSTNIACKLLGRGCACSRAGLSTGLSGHAEPSLGLRFRCRHMDYSREGNMDLVVQHQLRVKVPFLIISSDVQGRKVVLQLLVAVALAKTHQLMKLTLLGVVLVPPASCGFGSPVVQ